MRYRISLVIALALAVLVSLPAWAGEGVDRGVDLWKTPGNGSTMMDFSAEPIPAGFFCPGSEPFKGRIVFEGVPLASEDNLLGATDTIIERLDDAVFNRRGIGFTRVQVRALSLASVSPIVTSCGLYNVLVSLDGQQPTTKMKIVRTGADAGVFTAPLELRTKITFTPVAGRGREAVEMIHAIHFDKVTPIPWQQERVNERPVSRPERAMVDTDGDRELDTLLPTYSNFGAGAGVTAAPPALATAPRCIPIPIGCHCSSNLQVWDGGGTYTTGGYCGGCNHIHCPVPVEILPVDNRELN